MNARLTSVGLVITVLLAGPFAIGAEQTNARVIRIFFPEENTSAASRISVSGSNIFGLAAIGTFLTNKSVKPNDTDIVIVDRGGTEGAQVPRLARPFTEQLISFCYTSQVRLCFPQLEKGDPSIDSLMVVHWKSPFKDPRDHEHTSYFVEGSFLGFGDVGMTNVLNVLATRKPKAVTFAGSRYVSGGSYSNSEEPYDSAWWARLKEALRTNNIKLVYARYYLF